MDADVLIAGAGPTGLTAAIVLARAGVRVRIVDPLSQRSPHTRALVVHARTLELLQKLGIADELLEAGHRTLRVNLVVDGKLAAEVTLEDIGVEDSPYPFVLFVSQAETERALEECLSRCGVEVERQTEFAALASEDDEAVTVLLRRAGGGEERVRARYLLGADGAHSAVRKAAKLSFEGAPYAQEFMLADVRVTWNVPHDRLVLFLPHTGLCVAFPLKGDGRYRLLMTADANAEPTLAEVERLARSLTGHDLRLSEPQWLSRFHLHHRGVDHYRSPRHPRIFVAGDAAHIHSPVGGQGMNTGIQDAFNVAWKLAAVVGGIGGDALLDSYEAERLPVGRNLLSVTDRMFDVATSNIAALRLARRALAPRIARWIVTRPERRRMGFRFVSQLQIKYGKSAVVDEDTSHADRAFRAGPGAGHRAPDAPLGDSTLFRETTALEHHLLLFGATAEQETAARSLVAKSRWPIELVRVEGAVARKRYGVTGNAYYLLRPDGYVGFRGTPDDWTPLEGYLSRISA